MKIKKNAVVNEAPVKRGRGRPKKIVEAAEPIKKTRGRPKKVVEAVEPAKKTRGRPKTIVEAAVKPTRSVKKRMNKTADKKSDGGKAITVQSKKLFAQTRKAISTVKKLNKSISKLITTASKLDDPKQVDRIYKLFGYAGYTKTDSSIDLLLSTKVKVQKAKAPKTKANKIPEVKPEPVQVPMMAAKAPIIEEEPVPPVEIPVDPAKLEGLSDSASSSIESEGLTDDDLLDGDDENVLDEPDEEADTDEVEDEDQTEEDDQADYRREFFNQAAENGDYD